MNRGRMIHKYNKTAASNEIVQVKSTSANSADVTPKELRPTTDFSRLLFHPTIVRNSANPQNSVEGRITYERKGKNDPLFPLDVEEEKVSKGSINNGDALDLSLDSSETRALFEALNEMYSMYDDIGGIPIGTTRYALIDNATNRLLELLRQDASAARMIADNETFELVKELLKLLTQGRTRDELRDVFNDLEQNSLNSISESLSLEQLRRAESLIADNLGNNDENFWQTEVFEKHPWIISHIFSAPCTVFENKAYVGGKSIENANGGIVDFIFRNTLTNNVALVEIKTPATELLGKKYRTESYSLSKDLSGAVSQVLSYRQRLMTSYAALQSSSTRHFNAFHPQCVVILGTLDELADDKSKLSTFENFRQNLNGVDILTYDELLQRIRDLIALLSSSVNSETDTRPDSPPVNSYTIPYDEDIPF